MSDADWVNAIATTLTFVTTAIIGWFGWRLSLNQIKPFLYLDVAYGKDHTIILLKNEGLGPARITKVKYRLKDRKDDDLRVAECGWKDGPWREDTVTSTVPASPLAKLSAVVGNTVKTGCKFCRTCTQRAQLGGANTEVISNDFYLLEAKKVIPGARLGQFTNNKKDYWQESDLAGRVIRAGADVIVLQAYIRYNRNLETGLTDEYALKNRPGKAWQAALENKLAYGEVHIEYEDANGRRMKPNYVYNFGRRNMSKKDRALQDELDNQTIRECFEGWNMNPNDYMTPDNTTPQPSSQVATSDVEMGLLTADQQQEMLNAVGPTSGSGAQTSMQAAGLSIVPFNTDNRGPLSPDEIVPGGRHRRRRAYRHIIPRKGLKLSDLV